MKKFLFLVALLAASFSLQAQSGRVLITEFMAVNSNSIVDEDGQHSDWIEIYNATNEAIALGGWSLTDKDDNLRTWVFPDVVLQQDAYLVIFASGNDRRDPAGRLHTNFKLSGSGEFLAICEPDSSVSHAYAPLYPGQRQDVSYGLYHQQEVFFSTPTPGAENQTGDQPFTPQFSVTRGYFDTPFTVSLGVAGGQGTIYYTTDGTRPTKTSGTAYTAPVSITTTTPLSAVVINDAGISSEVVTHSYLFLKDVIRQPSNPAGYPANWNDADNKTQIPSDYEMDARVTGSPAYADRMEASLKALPVVHIVTTPGNLFAKEESATTGGIYIYTGLPHTESKSWSRPTSVEYYDPASGQEFQLNCRLQLHGGNSRRPTNSPKHGFELEFKSAYGPSKLNFDLFPGKGSAKEFNSLILRAGYNNTWVKNAATQQVLGQYLQDPFAKLTQLEMGQVSGRQKFVHLYLNGLYWGVYNLAEELDKDFMESYFGGDEDDYDVVKEQQTTTPTAGTMAAWNSLKSQITSVGTSMANYMKVQGRNADGSINPAYPNLLEVDNYIDYMLINYYIGNKDWDKNNWAVGRNRITKTEGFRFFCWDAETSMVGLNDNLVITGTSGNPAAFMQYLKKNPEFKVRVADRIKHHLLDAGGALSPAEAARRYRAMADEVELAMISESARWSDWYAPYNPYTLNDHWIPRRDALLNNYFPKRTDVVMSQLRAAEIYPAIDAPVFSHPGGNYSESLNLQITGSGGTIYYTTDGTDPRTPITGAVAGASYASALPLNTTTTVKARVKNSTEWSALTEASYVFNAISGIGDQPELLAVYSAWPNPFTDQTTIRVSLPVAGPLQVKVYGIDGRLVANLFEGNASHGDTDFSLSVDGLPEGMYLCRIHYNNTVQVLKLVKK